MALEVKGVGMKDTVEHDHSSSGDSSERKPWYKRLLASYLIFAMPGMGMFSEAYIIFSAGQIKPFQQALAPSCYGRDDLKLGPDPDVCDPEMVAHVAGYIQICGIIAGMLLWGFLGDITGRKWGSRSVAAIMLSGCILLTFTPWAPTAHGYFVFFMIAQTWYGFGVGGEYPMAASSAAEQSSVTPELRKYRGRQVALVFSNQGLGNFVNACVIAVCMAIFGQTGTQAEMTETGARNVLALMYGVGALTCLFMVYYRFVFLNESKMFEEVAHIEQEIAAEDQTTEFKLGLRKHMVSAWYFWPRQLVASVAWICNDFAFYGNKLQQGLFIKLLYPDATPYKQQQWTILNNFIALLGYYLAAYLMDKSWYGRRLMQNVGFIAMFVFYIIIYAQWDNMGAKGAPAAGVHAFQALYYLSSFFNQFGPNATTWLVAGEIFPTDIRATYHGFAAAMGKVGAIIASVWISYIADKRKVFLVSAIWGIAGAVVTWIWLPDTTGLELEEYDRLQRYIMEGRFKDYHGEALNPKHLSYWERFVLKWGRQYDRVLDKKQFETEVKKMAVLPDAAAEMQRMHVIPPEEFQRITNQNV